MSAPLVGEVGRTPVPGGCFREIHAADQWAGSWSDLIAKYNTPKAICGYAAPAVATYLAARLPGTSATHAEVNAVLGELRDERVVRDAVESGMRRVHDSRTAYVEAHGDEFPAASEAHKYLSDWVANFEISDWLQDVGMPCVHFLRHVERGSVNREELARVKEESPFRPFRFFVESHRDAAPAATEVPGPPPPPPAAAAAATPADAAVAAAAAGAGGGSGSGGGAPDSAAPSTEITGALTRGKHPVLRTPAAWVRAFGAIPTAAGAGSSGSTGPVFVVDMLGHFVAMKPLWLVPDGGGEAEATVLLVNTGKSRYGSHAVPPLLLAMAVHGDTTRPQLLASSM